MKFQLLRNKTFLRNSLNNPINEKVNNQKQISNHQFNIIITLICFLIKDE